MYIENFTKSRAVQWHDSHFQGEHALRELIPFLAFKKSEQSLSFSQVAGFSLRILVIVFLLRSRYTF